MFKKVLCFFLLSLASMSLATPLSDHGALSISGKNLRDKNGSNFQLRGMSFFWGNYYQEGRKYWNADVLDWLVRDWKVNVVRIPIGIDSTTSWASTGAAQTAAVKTMIDLCYAQGIYIIVDWHTHLTDASVQAQAKTFFTDISAYAAGKNNVLYEIFNEPLAVSWSSIKNYANTIIPAIRANDANGIIIVGTPNWSSEPDGVGTNRPSGSNIAYTLHFYAGEGAHSTYRTRGETAMNAGNCVFVTEWGTSAADGGVNSTYINTTESDTWISWMSTNNVSWANWTVSHKDESSNIFVTATNGSVPAQNYFGGWTSSDLKPTGVYVRGKLRAAAGYTANAWDTPTSSSSVASSSSAVAVVGKSMVHTLPGRIEAEDWQMAAGVSTELTTTEAVGDSNMSAIDPGDWAEYSVNCLGTAIYTLNYRVSPPPAAKGVIITVSVDGAPTIYITVDSTKSIITYETGTTYIALTEGSHTIRIDFSAGSSSKTANLMNMNWMDFLADITPTKVPVVNQLGVTMVRTRKDLRLQVPARYGRVELVARDIHGKILTEQVLHAGANTVDHSLWKNGLYLLSLRSSDGSRQLISTVISN